MTDDFANFGKDYVLFCHITTRVAADKHQDLLSEKGGTGFPHIVFMDSEGKVLAEHEDERTAKGFAETGKKAAAFLDLKQRAEKGDASAKFDFLLAQLELGQVGSQEAEKKWKELGKPAADQQARFDAALSGVAAMEIVKTIQDEESKKAAAKKIYEMWKAGKPAPAGDQAMGNYWGLVLDHAESVKDAAAFEAALKALRARFGDNPRAKKYFDDKEAKLKELKEGEKK